MKIIRKGWGVQKTQCSDCGTIFEFEDNETTIEETAGFTFKIINCPICNQMVRYKFIGGKVKN